MNILLLSMPDSFEHMPAVAIRMPNGALSSLAGNLDGEHRVAVADLILVRDRVRATVESLVRDLAPDLVGLSVMTFQRRTAKRVIELVRALRPQARVVVGGYDPSLAPEACSSSPFRSAVHATYRSKVRARLRVPRGGPSFYKGAPGWAGAHAASNVPRWRGGAEPAS